MLQQERSIQNKMSANNNIMLSVILAELNQKPISLAYCDKVEDEFSANDLAIVGAVAAAVHAPVDTNFVENYFEGTVPLYSPTTFASHFRMSRQTMQVIRCFKMSHNFICLRSLISLPLIYD